MRTKRLSALALLLMVPTVASAMTLDDLTPGTTVHGPDVSASDLKGKVVYVEYWGTR